MNKYNLHGLQRVLFLNMWKLQKNAPILRFNRVEKGTILRESGDLKGENDDSSMQFVPNSYTGSSLFQPITSVPVTRWTSYFAAAERIHEFDCFSIEFEKVHLHPVFLSKIQQFVLQSKLASKDLKSSLLGIQQFCHFHIHLVTIKSTRNS